MLRKLLTAERLGYAALQSVLLQVLTILANLCTGVITARLLGASGRGLYAASVTWPSLLGMVATAGVSTAVLVHLRRRPDMSTSVSAWGFGVALVVSTLLTAAAYESLPILLGPHQQAALPIARAALLFTHITALGVLYRAVFAGRGRFLLSNLAGMLPHMLHAVAASAFALAGALTVATATASVVLGATASLILLFPALLREVRGSARGLAQCAPELRHFALRAAPADLLSLCSGWADRLLLILLLSPRELGLYVVAYGFSRVVTVTTPATGILLSAMSEAETKPAKALHDMAIRISFVTLSATVLAIFMLDEKLIRLFYGIQFIPAVVTFEILVVQAAVSRIANVSTQFYLASNRPALNSWIGLCEVAVSASLMIALAPAMGAKGAALSMLAGTFVRLALLWACMLTHLRLPFPRLLPGRDDVRAIRALFES